MSFEEQLKELKIGIDKRLELFFSMIKARDDFISFSYKNIKDYLSSGGKRLKHLRTLWYSARPLGTMPLVSKRCRAVEAGLT